MAGGHFRAACEITLKRERRWMSEEKKKGESDWEKNIFFIREKCLELGMWFVLAAWGSLLDPDPTSRKYCADTGWTHTHSVDVNLHIQSALPAALEIFVGECWGRHVTRTTLQQCLRSCFTISRCALFFLGCNYQSQFVYEWPWQTPNT